MLTRRVPSPVHVRLAVFVILAGVTTAAACAESPTQVQQDELAWTPRKTDYICVRPGTGTTPPDTVPPDEHGTCGVGFEMLPWG